MQSIVADRALSGWMRPDEAEVQDEHVGRSSNDGEAQTDQRIKSVRLHVWQPQLPGCWER